MIDTLALGGRRPAVRWYVLPRGRIQHVVFSQSRAAVASPCGSVLPAADDPRASAVAVTDELGFTHLHSCGRCYRAAHRVRR